MRKVRLRFHQKESRSGPPILEFIEAEVLSQSRAARSYKI